MEQRYWFGCSEMMSREIIEENALWPNTEEGRELGLGEGCEGLLKLRVGTEAQMEWVHQ